MDLSCSTAKPAAGMRRSVMRRARVGAPALQELEPSDWAQRGVGPGFLAQQELPGLACDRLRIPPTCDARLYGVIC